MTHEQFEALVARLEAQAGNDPKGYQRRVLGLALLGYAYLGAILLLVAGIIAAVAATLFLYRFHAATLKIVIALGLFLAVLVKSLWIRLEPPQGMALGEAPALRAMIEELRVRLGAPRFHRILVTGDFNASVVQAASLGLFGWSENYLLIGLPLMKALTVEQFRAVLAHELGHLAADHGRVANWLYMQRLRWSRLEKALEDSESRGQWLFKPFLNWYIPFFAAYSFPLARANEFEADATSKRLTSARAAAEALTGVNVLGEALDRRYWPGILRHAEEIPEPSFTPYAQMHGAFAVAAGDADARAWLEAALAEKTSTADTHPALTDRLKALGETPHLAPPASGEAADQLLGPACERIAGLLDAEWKRRVAQSWNAHYKSVQERRGQRSVERN